MTDVGDAVTLTFATTTGATVTVDVYDPTPLKVVDAVAVPESPSGSGLYPYTQALDTPGMWRVVFNSTGAVTATEPHWVRADSPALPPLATMEDLTGRTQLDDARIRLGRVLIIRASALVRGRWADIDSRIAAGTLDVLLAAEAVTEMVLRVLRNPDALRQKTVGPFSVTYDLGQAAGFLAVTAAEAGLLAPVVTGAAGRGVRTIRVAAGLAPSARPWGSW